MVRKSMYIYIYIHIYIYDHLWKLITLVKSKGLKETPHECAGHRRVNRGIVSAQAVGKLKLKYMYMCAYVYKSICVYMYM